MKMKVDNFLGMSLENTMRLVIRLTERFKGIFSLEPLPDNTFDLIWDAPKGKGGYTLERVQSFVEGYMSH